MLPPFPRGNTINVELRLPTKSSVHKSLPQRVSHPKTIDNCFGVACHAERERKERACERRVATIKAEGQEGDHEVVDEVSPAGRSLPLRNCKTAAMPPTPHPSRLRRATFSRWRRQSCRHRDGWTGVYVVIPFRGCGRSKRGVPRNELASFGGSEQAPALRSNSPPCPLPITAKPCM